MVTKRAENPNQPKWRHYAATFLAEARLAELEKPYIDTCLQYAKPLILDGLPVIYDHKHFSKLVGFSTSYVYGAIKQTEGYYRTFSIRKKSGSERIISEPLPNLKEIQRWIVDNILVRVKISAAAKAFSPGCSIKENAKFHVRQKKLAIFDISDFFGSIKSNRVYSCFRRIGYSQHVSLLLTDLCCLNGSLPQGAPTSPYISNIIFKFLDDRYLEYAKAQKIRYTRYADDLVFSGDLMPSAITNFIYKSLRENGFEPNLEKTRILDKSDRQIVTGIVVNKKLQSTREFRRKLRQESYFIQKFGIEQHSLWSGNTKAFYVNHLLGKANFVLYINSEDRDALLLRSLFSRDTQE